VSVNNLETVTNDRSKLESSATSGNELKANTDAAHELASMISDFVQYGQVLQKLQNWSRSLRSLVAKELRDPDPGWRDLFWQPYAEGFRKLLHQRISWIVSSPAQK
jgi:hypothetical protein